MATSNKEIVKLYSFCHSSCSFRVRIALAYKGISYEYIAINLSQGEQFSDDFKKINAFSTVPVLVDNGFIVSDSLAILEYLEEKYPEPSLFPADSKKRALVRQVVNNIVSSIQPLQNLNVLKKIEALAGSDERLKWAQYFIENGFIALEALLTTEAGKCCFGDKFSMADAVLIPQVYNARRFKVDMEKFPLLKRIAGFIEELPFVQAAKPEKQPDFVPLRP
ncbi:hypothetical protein KP509_05G069400 [Ceratopteris richardii]|uniref:glutathione transferase n=1 Tax=Ceratopteris richardii TaxID=49495 RepID=A0A8T2URL7_CERRI|nr:hypothetical protein KP509_05G069400 [Ceratopteris richardii]